MFLLPTKNHLLKVFSSKTKIYQTKWQVVFKVWFLPLWLFWNDWMFNILETHLYWILYFLRHNTHSIWYSLLIPRFENLSLLFYGFKKLHNVWTAHPYEDATNCFNNYTFLLLIAYGRLKLLSSLLQHIVREWSITYATPGTE